MSQNGIAARIKAVTADGKSKKILMFTGLAAAAAVVYSMMPGTEQRRSASSVVAPPRAETIQGGLPLTPDYQEQIRRDDRQRTEAAREAGGTSMPTVVVSSQQPTPVMIPPEKVPPKPPEADPPKTPPIEQKPIVVSAPPVAPIVTPAVPVQNQQDVQRLGEFVASVTRRNWAVAEVQYMYDRKGQETSNTPAQSAPSVPTQPTGKAASKVKNPLAGTILYATLVGRANSDAPGPVLAKILQGPYAGATLLGTFTTHREGLVIKFAKMTVGTTPDGEEINETVEIDAVAVDTKHIGTSLATSVDRHLFAKIGIGLAASFAEGFGRAVAQNNSTSTYRSDGSYTSSTSQLDTRQQLLSAGGQAIASTGNILMDEFGKRPTTIIVDQGTPLGVLFL